VARAASAVSWPPRSPHVYCAHVTLRGVQFTAYTTYTDGKSNTVDETLGRSYLAVLQKFATLSTSSGKGDSDSEFLNRHVVSRVQGCGVYSYCLYRTRLVGLAALTGAISSDALYSSIESAKSQVAVIVPALLRNASQAGLILLMEQ
jgi:protein EFR3